MRSFIRTVLSALTVLVLVVTQARAQTYQCVAASNEYAVGLREYVRMLVTGTAPQVAAARDTFHLLPANSGQVGIVTQTSKCEQAGAAFEADVNPPLSAAAQKATASAVSRIMIVIKIHTSRYVVSDPDHRGGEWRIALVTDQSFNVLGSFVY